MAQRQTIKAHIKSQFSELGDDSSPARGTFKTSDSQELEVFFTDFKNQWQQSVAVKHKYKLAEVVHHNYDLRKRWYVIFYAWDVSTESLRRRRLFHPINKAKTVRQRLDVAESMVRMINKELREGKVLGKDDDKPTTDQGIIRMTVAGAFKFVSGEKKLKGYRKSYYRGFDTIANIWGLYLDHYKQSEIKIRDLTRDQIAHYLQYLKQERKLSNKTFNNYKDSLVTAINYLMNIEPKLFKVNPGLSIESLPTIARKHAAYTDKQIKSIKAECIKSGETQLLLFIQFIYYTLARPNELIRLKVKHIDLEQNRILIPGMFSKTRFDEYVGISSNFKNEIKKSGILKCPGEHFIFGKRKKGPAEEGYYRHDMLWERNKKILKATGLHDINDNYTLYSYKHSGAISLYVATKDIKLVQRQCRHKTLNQTNDYLRDLGLVSGLEGLNLWEGAA